MAKTRRELEKSLSGIDLVAEIVDARIPSSSRNPMLSELTASKKRIIVLNRNDLADPEETARWLGKYGKECGVMSCDSKSGKGCSSFLPAARRALADRLDRMERRGIQLASLKIMVVGIPNVGKSSFINRISGRCPARAEDRPGVTRAKNWYRLENGLDLLDTPGMLWPKLDDETAAQNLAFTGAIRDEIIDTDELAIKLLFRLSKICPDMLENRLGITKELFCDGEAMLSAFGEKRGFLVKGGGADISRAALKLLDEFRSGALGRITLERAE